MTKRGQFNSTKTRVAPVFDEIYRTTDWFTKLLRYSLNKYNKPVPDFEKVLEQKWGNNEKKIVAPKALLLWMISNTEQLCTHNNYGSKAENTRELRKKLFERNVATYKEAERLLSNNCRQKWCTFEGTTNVDVFIETEGFIFIAEGKRTEKEQTKKTKWMKSRDQIVRNIDSIHSMYQGKPIYAFYIIEDEPLEHYEKWKSNLEMYKNDDYIRKSLPHRNDSEIKLIKESYIGHLTWTEILDLFELKKDILPNTC